LCAEFGQAAKNPETVKYDVPTGTDAEEIEPMDAERVFNFTPGEWKFVESRVETEYKIESFDHVETRREIVAHLAGIGGEHEQDNGRLIAAAPDMFIALTSVQAELEHADLDMSLRTNPLFSLMVDSVAAAIRKAAGPGRVSQSDQKLLTLSPSLYP
jgi:hypothetical protein